MSRGSHKNDPVQEELDRRALRDVVIRRGDTPDAFLLYVDTVFKNSYKKHLRKEWWHPLIARALMDIYMGLNDRLIIEEPPRSGKTEFSVRQFASYIQGIDPTLKVQYATYGATLSEVVSGETKGIMESALYGELFPSHGFDPKLNTKAHWRNAGGGGFQGSSVDGATTGMGSEVFILDDLHKATEAHSPAKRRGVQEFYSSSVLTRLEGRKAVIVIMQRLNEDDLVGHLKREDGTADAGGAWEVLTLPLVNDMESFTAFYDWVECKDENRPQRSEAESAEIRNIAAKGLKEDILAYKVAHRHIKPAEFSQYKKKREQVRWYEAARLVYLHSHSLPDMEVYYRDMVVTRPPLTTLSTEEYGLDFAVKQYRSVSKADFLRQYMQDPEEKEAGFFKRESMSWVSDLEIPSYLSHYILVDNAESLEDAADDRGLVVVGKWEQQEEIYTAVLDGRAGKWDVYGSCEQLIALMLLYPDAPVLIEGAGGGITLEVVLHREIATYNARAQEENRPQVKSWVRKYKPDNQVSKNSVINMMSHPLESGCLVFRKMMDSGFAIQLTKEILAYNPERRSNEDNVIDPLSKSFVRPEVIAGRESKPVTATPQRRTGGGGKIWNGV
ncbi:MAG: hypothetical protein HF962_00545 [Sulfurovum sp.]|nr:hypothetical protein [Sulfurovum sp.]